MALDGIAVEQSTAYPPVSSFPVKGQEPAGGSGVLAASSGATLGTQPKSPDTVKLSSKLQEVRQQTSKAEVSKDESRRGAQLAKMGDVLFIYTPRGDLRVRFMDSANWLIYQLPPLMMTRMADLMGRNALRVSMKV